jgi:hypothetical protein
VLRRLEEPQKSCNVIAHAVQSSDYLALVRSASAEGKEFTARWDHLGSESKIRKKSCRSGGQESVRLGNLVSGRLLNHRPRIRRRVMARPPCRTGFNSA